MASNQTHVFCKFHTTSGWMRYVNKLCVCVPDDPSIVSVLIERRRAALNCPDKTDERAREREREKCFQDSSLRHSLQGRQFLHTINPSIVAICSEPMACVCVTGGTGYIATWLIKTLLARGYNVRATVRDPGNQQKTAHLWSLPNALGNLELVKADLLDDGSFDAAVDGCEGVFHVASPVVMVTENPQEDLIAPAVKGTLNVLNACARAESVKRVVMTSSMAAVMITPKLTDDVVLDETFWSDPEYCKQTNIWYLLSKLLAEQTAWSFAEEHKLDLVVINPGLAVGPILQPHIDAGAETILDTLNGTHNFFKTISVGWVDVRDVVEAHILAYEVPTAFGRFICVDKVLTYAMLLNSIQQVYPYFSKSSKHMHEPIPEMSLFKVSSEKLKGLGFKFRPTTNAIKDCIDSLRERKLLNIALF